jgi:tetraacyldisaccharide 4'-kinase
MRFLCTFLSVFVSLAVRIRRSLYARGLMPIHRVGARVVSVGNVSIGGSGKTPAVNLIADYLRAKNRGVVILTRGYGRVTRGPRIIFGGAGNWREVGDEPLMLSRTLPTIPIVVDRDRVSGGRLAIERFGSRFLILDDGLQHLRLARDVDVVIIDATRPFGNGRLFPGGVLREDLSALRRAHLFFVTKVNQAEGVDDLVGFLQRACPQTPVILGTYEPKELRDVVSHAQMSLASLRGEPVIAMSGIANPISFEQSLDQMGARLVEKVRFPDHHPYCQRDVSSVLQLAQARGARYVVTTEKDEVRLPAIEKPRAPIFSLGIQLKVVSGAKQLWDLIERGSSKWP